MLGKCWAALILAALLQGCAAGTDDGLSITPNSATEAAPSTPKTVKANTPNFSVTSVYRPTYVTREGTRTVGTAFVIARQNRYLAVTAHHVFSDAGGFSRDFRWDEVADLIEAARFEALDGDNQTLESHRLVPVEGARAVSGTTGRHDIAFFELDGATVTHLRLASEKPKVGDAVWLHAPIRNRPEEQLFHRAVVTEYNRDWISYRFDDADLKTGGTSGAAIVNRRGEVVGVNLSGGLEGNELFGSGNPLGSLRRVLKRLQPSSPSGE